MVHAPTITRTESRKKYTCGFALTEGEVRRLHDVLVQQIKRTPAGDEFKARYELKFQNGSVTFPATLDEILAEENFGAASISRLRMDVFDNEKDSSNLIRVQFQTPDAAEWSIEEPIMFTVKGQDRDWAFVTSSQLEERIQKIRLFALDWRNDITKEVWLVILPIIFMVVAGLLFLVVRENQIHIQAMKEIESIQRDWVAGALKDPEGAWIRTVRALNYQDLPDRFSYWFLGIIIAVTISLSSLNRIYSYFHPAYNFIWGDYIETYEKRKSHGRLLLLGVVLALLISIAANIISKRMGI